MKQKTPYTKFVVFITVTILFLSLYRALPFRLPGFAPQIALAFFCGCIFKNYKSQMFLLPIISMFVSDVIYQFLYAANLTSIKGFYGWEQGVNYIFIALCAIAGMYSQNKSSVIFYGGAFLSATFYFIVSNTFVWITFGGYARPHSVEGYFLCMNEALPFYVNSLFATMLFSFMFKFLYHALIKKIEVQHLNHTL